MRATKGSQKWLQVAVNERPDVLNRAIIEAVGLDSLTTINWLSPLADENYVEYRDGAFIKKIGAELPHRSLESFWPNRGPVWDGLARTSAGEILLVEAKAHIAEMVSPASKASRPSLAKITRALKETQRALAPRTSMDWSRTFYQYTNRLAHLYFLRTLNRLPARMIFLYFMGDQEMGGPDSQAEWEGAINVTEVYLGLQRHKLSRYVHHVFVDVRDLRE